MQIVWIIIFLKFNIVDCPCIFQIWFLSWRKSEHFKWFRLNHRVSNRVQMNSVLRLNQKRTAFERRLDRCLIGRFNAMIAEIIDKTNLHLEHAEALGNAVALSDAERQVRKRNDFRNVLGRESFGVEGIRLGPIL